MIPFNKPYITESELIYISEILDSGKVSGNGKYTKLCETFFERRFKFKKTLLTTSCTDALEMAAILADIQPGDEVIIPSYTFVSTANAFKLRGAIIKFADSSRENPNIDVDSVESLITSKTKVIVVVHYAGIAVDMDLIMEISRKYGIIVVEDAAQAIDSFYKDKPLGSIGHFGAFSFHDTKNVICGEGGMLVINDKNFFERAEIIWEKGTNRSAFMRGEVSKYGWMDIGSSFLPSEILAGFLYGQLEKLDYIQKTRKEIWNTYYNELNALNKNDSFQLPYVPDYAYVNGHIFYLVCSTKKERDKLIYFLSKNGIQATFHYLSLHKSQYYTKSHNSKSHHLPWSDLYTDRLVRLPLFVELTPDQLNYIIKVIGEFYSL